MTTTTKFHKVSYWGKVITLGLVVGLGLQIVSAWTAPTAVAPGGVIDGPITTSAIAQTKDGPLTVNSATNGLSGNGGTGYGLTGISTDAHGIYGKSNSATRGGVVGVTANDSAWGVLGNSDAQGVYGYSTVSQGIYGRSTVNHGAYGQSDANGYGVYGRTLQANRAGVIGYSGDNSVYGMLGYNNTYSLYGNGSIRADGNIFANTSGSNNYVRSDEVRANEYCAYNGTNCFTPGSSMGQPTISTTYSCGMNTGSTKTCNIPGTWDVCFMIAYEARDGDDLDGAYCFINQGATKKITIWGEDFDWVSCQARCLNW